MKTSDILGVKINHDLTITEAVDLIHAKVCEKTPFQVCTTNPEFIVDAQKDKEFKDIINSAEFSLPDGSGIVFALDYLQKVSTIRTKSYFKIRAFILGLSLVTQAGKYTNFPPIYGTDLTDKLLELANAHGYTVGLLGGRAKNKWGQHLPDVNVALLAADTIRHTYPNIKIVIADSHINASADSDDDSIALISKDLMTSDVKHIDMLFVAFGHNRQEKWIARNSSKVPATLFIGIGGTLDDIAGYGTKPSAFYTRYNLRWLYRLLRQPWRIKRIAKATLLFPLLVFLDILKH